MTDTTTVTLKDKAMSDSLRELADFLDANPDIAEEVSSAISVYMFSYTEDDFRNRNQQLGTFDKKSDSYGLEAVKRFGKIRLVHSISHDRVCELKVVGTKVIKKLVPKDVQPEVEMIEIEVEEDVTEWVCPETWR